MKLVVAVSRPVICTFLIGGGLSLSACGGSSYAPKVASEPWSASVSHAASQRMLFVLNEPGGSSAITVTGYRLSYNKNSSPVSINLTALGLDGNPSQIAVNSQGDLLVAVPGQDQYVGSTIFRFAPPYKAKPTSFVGVSFVYDMFLDQSGDLFVCCEPGSSSKGVSFIQVFKWPYNKRPIANIPDDCSASAAVGADGSVFVDSSGCSRGAATISLYKPPYKTPTVTFGSGISSPSGLVVGPHDELFAYKGSVKPKARSILLWRAPYTSSPQTIKQAVNGPYAMLVSANGDLFVANAGSDRSIKRYAPPYRKTPQSIGPLKLPVTQGFPESQQPMALSQGMLLSISGPTSVVQVAPPKYKVGASISDGITRPAALAATP